MTDVAPEDHPVVSAAARPVHVPARRQRGHLCGVGRRRLVGAARPGRRRRLPRHRGPRRPPTASRLAPPRRRWSRRWPTGSGVVPSATVVQVGDGPNLEARARAARYAALPADVLTGHTADDQAETMLVNLLRGAGRSGLAAMRPGPRRPLLGAAPRRHRGPVHADSASTWCTTRRTWIPAISATGFATSCCRCSRHRPAATRCRYSPVRPICSATRPTCSTNWPPGSIPPTPKPWPAAPLPLARRAVRRWLTTEHPPDAATVERVLGGGSGRGRRDRRRRRAKGRTTPPAPAPAPLGKLAGRASNLSAHSLHDVGGGRDAPEAAREVGARHNASQLHVVHERQTGGLRAPGRLRRQPSPRAPAGGDHLAAGERLRLRDQHHPRTAQPAQLRRAGPARTCTARSPAPTTWACG